MEKFIGREQELKQLIQLSKKSTSSLVVIKGRRRIGKSRLIQEFGKKFPQYLEFSALPPTENTHNKHIQKHHFIQQISQQFDFPLIQTQDWLEIFDFLVKQLKPVKTLILFDEISWMANNDPEFLGKLKVAWDLYFKKHPSLILVLCGSISSWIDKNVLNHTGFLGRISLELTLKELSLPECNQFWEQFRNRISTYEKLKILSVTGGVPRYLEEINPQQPAETNLRHLCFTEGGILTQEFDRIFSDLFSNRAPLYREIIHHLALKSSDLETICTLLNKTKSGTFSDYLNDLETAGFISRDFTWNLKTGGISKLSKYRLSDNYLRFYLKFIAPNKEKIKKGLFQFQSYELLPNWEAILGMQFENLVLNNRKSIQQYLGLANDDIVFENPYFQRTTHSQSGCQIDYLIHTRFNNLYICEIKFSKKAISNTIIPEIQKKLDRLAIPKNFSLRPVLICAEEPELTYELNHFFDKIIPVKAFLV